MPKKMIYTCTNESPNSKHYLEEIVSNVSVLCANCNVIRSVEDLFHSGTNL